MTVLNNCPCCGGRRFEPFISCKDFTVSKEQFHIVSCLDCTFKFTNPRPDDSTIGSYYKSDDYISHSDTKKGIVSRLYHIVRGYTLNKKERMLLKYVSRGTLLDYGCGTGMFLNTCKDRGWECFGMEPDNGARGIASQRGSRVAQNLQELQSLQVGFDAITLWHVLEHVTDLSGTLSFFKANLKKDGVLVLALPNYKSYDAVYYKEFWAAYDVPRHLYHFEVSTIQKLLAGFGFSLVDAHPMKFDSFYVSMLSEKYKNGSTNMLAAFWRGLLSNLRAKNPTEYSSVVYVFRHV